jgi:hypothetical protein
MITARYYRTAEDYFLVWDYTTLDELKALRKLLTGTNTSRGPLSSHYITRLSIIKSKNRIMDVTPRIMNTSTRQLHIDQQFY